MRTARRWTSPLLAAAVASLCACSRDDGVAERGLAVVADRAELRDYAAGKAFAVAIGVDDYEHAPRLDYAAADARAVGSELERHGYDVTTLLNEEATLEAIRGAIGDELPRKVSREDRVVIFFAGHGQTRKFEGGGEVGFLIPVAGSFERLRQTAIDMGEIKSLADELPAKHVLFLIDACYGGIAGLRGRSAAPKVDGAYLRSITRDRGRQLITAGGADEEAHESAEWGHSAFTHVLLKGLRDGLADLNTDGIVPASELHQYLERNVFEAVRQAQSGSADAGFKEQRPQYWQLAADRGELVFFVDPNAPPSPDPDPSAAPPEASGVAETAAPADTPQAGADENGEVAALSAEVARLEQEQAAASRLLDELHQQAEGALRQVRTDGAPARSEPPLPPKDWSCTGNQVVVNGVRLSNRELAQLVLMAGGQPVEPGCYWYDKRSGMWGWEGQPSAGDLPPDLDLGGALRADASAGDSGVLMNGRELTTLEVQRFGAIGGPRRPGRYWMNARGVGGPEGRSASFNLAAGIMNAAQAAAQAAVEAAEPQVEGAAPNDTLYQSGDTHGGVQGDCVYMSGSDFSYVGEGCE